MSSPLDSAHSELLGLIAKYEAHRHAYLLPDYSEAQAREDFINKFLTILGWDVSHDIQTNPFEQEVKVERGQDQRRADYAFFVAPNFRDVRFFVEAKKPSVELAAPDHYFQTVRYGWNSQTPISFLTNFEGTHVLDCRYKPHIDSILECSVKRFHFTELGRKDIFAELYWLMSHEAAESGSLERFAEQLPKRRGKAIQRGLFRGGFQAINDESFLEELDGYRDTLARSLKNTNPSLDGETLTEITQRILDRLVFLRFLEDKLIETEVSVAKLGDKGSVWRDFVSASRQLDAHYNGIVFKKHALIDGANFEVDEKVFGDICEDISHDNSPYDFHVIPIHILGSIYERFLGKVIVTTEKRAHVEEKPEVRKAGGVYYTPEYIVRYIVARTVGRLVEDKTPTQISHMRFADIACGSGSFLLGIFDFLLRYHRHWYNQNRDKARATDARPHDDGTLHLTLQKKREILLNNIYGIDIDPQAVEVAQLSLYLKLLEEETTASARHHQHEIREALLPPLDKNIRCGNSLFESKDVRDDLFDGGNERQLHPLTFATAFPKVAETGGFDAIVGNPPYFNVDDTWGKQDPRLALLKKVYPDIHTDKTDILFYFLGRAVALSKGYVGFIVSRAFLEAYKAAKLRKFLAQERPPQEIVDFRNYHVFKGVGITTCLVTLGDHRRASIDSYQLVPDELPSPELPTILRNPDVFRHVEGRVSSLGQAPWVFVSKEVGTLQGKIDKAGEAAGSVLQIGQGMQTGLNEVFGGHSRATIRQFDLDSGQFFRRATNSQIHAFRIVPKDEYVFYLEDVSKFSDLPKSVQKFLEGHKTALQSRAAYRRGDCAWWKFTWPLRKELYGGPKILCPYLATTNRFALDTKNEYLGLTDTTVLFAGKHKEDLHYFLGILNSSLLTFRFQSIGKLKAGGVLEYFWNSVSNLPIRRIDFSDRTDRELHDAVVGNSKRLMDTEVEQSKALTDKDKNYYSTHLTDLFMTLDEIVFELYGISKKDRSLVLEAVNRVRGFASSSEGN